MKSASTTAKAARYFGPLLLWMLIIFSFSTDRASADRTRPAVGGILNRLFPAIAKRLTFQQLDRVDWNIRKAAHITEYAILAILTYRAVAYGDPRFRHRNVWLPFLIGVLYAASDEYHQSFYPSRGGKAADVVFDSFGVSLGLLLCLWHHATTAAKKSTAGAGEQSILSPRTTARKFTVEELRK